VGSTHLRSDFREHGEITASITNIQTASLSVQTIQLDIDYPQDSAIEGQVRWNSVDGTMEYGLAGGNVVLQVGQESVIRVVNKIATNIADGDVVYLSGAQGGRPTVALTQNDVHDPSHVIGMATEDIDINANGYVTVHGLVRDLDTSAWTAGDSLYIAATPGGYRNSMPEADRYVCHVGHIITSNADSGIIFISPNVHPQLEHMSLVASTPASISGQVLSWNTGGYYELATRLYVGNAASNVTISQRSGIRFTGIDIWDSIDINAAAVQINPGTSKPDTVDIGIGKIQTLGFDNTSSEWVSAEVTLPHSWKEGTDIHNHISWMGSDDSAGGVRWVLEYAWVNREDQLTSVATLGVTGTAASDLQIIDNEFADISGSGKTIGSHFVLSLTRNVTHSEDTYGADALLLDLDFHYLKDGIGSDQEDAKNA